MGHASRTLSSATSRRQRGALALIVVATVTLSILMSGPFAPVAAQASSPTAESTPGIGATPPAEGLTPKMAKAVEEVIAQTVPVRQLPAADDVRFRVIDADTLRAELAALVRSEFPADYFAAEDDLYTRLGLIAPDDNLEQLTLSLYESQALAYYDPVTKTFSLVGPVKKIGPLEATVVAHEYGHALQDARWDLEGSRIKDLSRADEILANQALIEGDATALMADWSVRELGWTEQLRMVAEANSRQDEKILTAIPQILRRQLEFPYIDGLAFVTALRGRGDWAAVDEAWDARPRSTEQILHPEFYPDETPVEVALPDVAALLGPGWRAPYERTMGEMQIGVWVADGRKPSWLFLGLPRQLPRADAAAGWGGDRLVNLDGPDGSWAVVWQTDWDSSADADEFQVAAKDAMKDLDGVHAVADVDIAGGLSSPVLVTVADSKATLSAIQAALGLDS